MLKQDQSDKKKVKRFILKLMLLLALSPICAQEEGFASWYGWKFHGRQTANGEIFDMNKLTAAHKTLPFGTVIQVTNVQNDLSVIVRINDRGPFVEKRIIDLSKAAADAIGLSALGVAWVRLQLIEEAKPPQFTVQVGAYREEKNALRTVEKIDSHGLKATLDRSQEGIIRVIVENVSGSEVDGIKQILNAAGFTKILVKMNRDLSPDPPPSLE